MPPILAVLALLPAACHCGGASQPAEEESAPVRELSAERTSAKTSDPAAEQAGCEARPFAESIPIPEASGAVYLPGWVGGDDAIAVVGDSGTGGVFALLDPESGAVLERGELPLGEGASDDLEGLSAAGDLLYGLTSAGWVRSWRRSDGGFVLTSGPYRIGDPDDGEVCEDGADTNCGRNYEGLCLRRSAAPGEGCAGFAAAKSDGHLYCLLLAEDGSLSLDSRRRIDVTHREALTGCHFAPEGDLLFAGTNAFAANAVYRVQGASEPKKARVEMVGALGRGFSEATAVGPGGLVYRFSDLAGRQPSLVSKYRCR